MSIQEDLYYPHPLIQDLIWDSCYVFTEPLLTRWPFNKLRQKALEVTMKHIHYEDENSRYITIGCVEKVKQNSSLELHSIIQFIFDGDDYKWEILTCVVYVGFVYACLLG